MSGRTKKGPHLLYSEGLWSFYFLPADVAALCEGWVLYRLGKQSRTCKGVGGEGGCFVRSRDN
jgi:hypothetical protein